VKLQIVLGDKTYVADVAEMFNKMTIGQIRAIRRETGMTSDVLLSKVLALKDAEKPGNHEDWDVNTALVFLVLSRSDWHVTWADVERIPLMDIVNGWSVIEEAATEPAPVEEAELGPLVMVDG
jgi:hypothetical protein